MQIFADAGLRVDAACSIKLSGLLRDITKGAGLHSFFRLYRCSRLHIWCVCPVSCSLSPQ